MRTTMIHRLECVSHSISSVFLYWIFPTGVGSYWTTSYTWDLLFILYSNVQRSVYLKAAYCITVIVRAQALALYRIWTREESKRDGRARAYLSFQGEMLVPSAPVLLQLLMSTTLNGSLPSTSDRSCASGGAPSCFTWAPLSSPLQSVLEGQDLDSG